MRKILYVFFLFFLSFSFVCLGDNKEKLSPKQMKEDIDYFFNTLKNVHPCPYWKFTEQQFDSFHIGIEAKCNREMLVNKFRILLAQLNNYVDGHTGFKYGIFDGKLSNTLEIPNLHLRKDTILFDNYSILNINGINATQIAGEIDNIVSWEFPETYRDKDKKWYFKYYLNEFYDLNPPFRFTIYDSTTNTIKDTLVDLAPAIDYGNPSFSQAYHSNVMSERFFVNDSIAILYYNTSSIYTQEGEPNHQRINFIDSITNLFFAKAIEKNIKYVFIDVSQNGGGSDAAHYYITRFLNTQPFEVTVDTYITSEGLNLFPIPLDSLSLRELKEKGYYRTLMKEKRHTSNLQSSIFVIMGNNTFSAGADFCEEIKRGNAGILVGESTGQRFPFAGNMIQLTLPNSKMLLYCATIFHIMEPFISAEGFLQPDIPYPLDHPLELEDFKKIIELSKKNSVEK